MLDKLARLAVVLERGTLKVQNETIQDTLLDLQNYCHLLAAIIHEKSLDQTTDAGCNAPKSGSSQPYDATPVAK